MRKPGAICFLSLFASTWAAPVVKIEKADVGGRTITLSVDESIQIADLRSIQIEGYDIEQATLVDEGDSLVLSPMVLDLTAKDAPKIREVIPTLGKLVLEAPLYFTPRGGQVLADTAFGGVLCRITSFLAESGMTGISRRWVIFYEPASVEDVFIDADLTFSSTLDFTVTPADSSESSTVLGLGNDSTLASAFADFGWSDSRILFRPEISGRLRMRRGKLASFGMGIKGLAEATGKFHLALTGKGSFSWERKLPLLQSLAIPLGHGVQIAATHQPVIGFQAEAQDSSVAGKTDFRLRQEVSGWFPSQSGQMPVGDARLSQESAPLEDFRGEGTLRFQVKSLLSLDLGASDAHRLSLVHEATMTQTAIDSNWQSPVLGMAAADKPGKGLALSLSNLAKSTFHSKQQPVSPTPWQRKFKLGGSLSMEQRLDSLSPPTAWLLYNRELPLWAPPKTLSAQLLPLGGNRFALTCQTLGKADWFKVQMAANGGEWTTLVERASGPRIKLPEFPGDANSRVRVIAGNAFGVSEPWPLDGLALPRLNQKPVLPYALLPENGTVTDTVLRLSWSGGDKDSGDKVTYQVLLDTQNPPLDFAAAASPDSFLNVLDLNPGTQYFWQVRAFDGKDSVDGPIRSFSTFIPTPPQPIRATARSTGGNPWIYLQGGSFTREDEAEVSVGAFFIQKFEVTQREFQKVMESNPSYRLKDSLPVDRVTWDEAQAYCEAIDGRLPTEAEWEFAARGGVEGLQPWKPGKAPAYAWFRENSGGKTQPVGLLKPNAYGLYDMAGNVFEWVEDWYAPYDPDRTRNPQGPSTGTAKVIRGASWYSEESNLGPRNRFSNRPGFRNYKVGFRCAEDAPVSAASAENASLSAAN